MDKIKSLGDRDRCIACGSININITSFGSEYQDVECRDCNHIERKEDENGNKSETNKENASTAQSN